MVVGFSLGSSLLITGSPFLKWVNPVLRSTRALPRASLGEFFRLEVLSIIAVNPPDP